MTFYQEYAAEIAKQDLSRKDQNQLKRTLALKHNLKTIPTNIEILLHLPEKDIPSLLPKLLTKPTRTISGVAPVAIMSKPFPCPHAKTAFGPCIMCPGGPLSHFGNVPQSYTGKEPATMRGLRNNFDPYLQIFNRLQQYVLLGQNFDKVELIVMGGTFPSFPEDYQEEFIRSAFQALNDFAREFYSSSQFDYLKFKKFFELNLKDDAEGTGKDESRVQRVQQKILQLKEIDHYLTLEQQQLRNETSKVRCVALCLETRPDYGLLPNGNEMLRLGCTRVELGIQSVYDQVLENIRRSHDLHTTKESIRTLKDLGFKVAAHYMPGLPGLSRRKDLAGMKKLFSNQNFRPDMLKIYPCLVIPGTKLYEHYLLGKYQPLTAEEAAEMIVKFKKHVPEYCRIIRVQRDIPSPQVAAGVLMTNFRQHIHENYKVKCRCIRCREPKSLKIDWDHVKIKVKKYRASKGKEFFISVEDRKNDLLLGFCRMRFPSQYLRPEITKHSALIRELHIYGTAVGIGSEGSIQHKGWGKKLLATAEQLAKRHKKDKMVVISGIGVREYYRKLGYQLEGPYMVKRL
jgi:elongator complex protein 3